MSGNDFMVIWRVRQEWSRKREGEMVGEVRNKEEEVVMVKNNNYLFV